MGAALPGPHAVDAHVHVHACFDVRRFLDDAAANVTRALTERPPAGATRGLGVLLLAEGVGEGAFDRLSGASALGGGWTAEDAEERGVRWLAHHGTRRLLVVAGRQVVTAEGVEVLALLTHDAPADGLPLGECLASLAAHETVAVLPWGFGKWSGRRGRLVAESLRASDRTVLAGDNGGRLALGPTPPLLAEAARRGIPILPGSDPLPFPDQEGRAGSFGFLADVALPPERPAAALRAWLRALDRQPDPYGRLRGVAAFCFDQGRMQWRKRVGRSR